MLTDFSLHLQSNCNSQMNVVQYFPLRHSGAIMKHQMEILKCNYLITVLKYMQTHLC